MRLAQDKFLDELKALMQKHGVVELTYTIDDDGIHARTELGEDWILGWIRS